LAAVGQVGQLPGRFLVPGHKFRQGDGTSQDARAIVRLSTPQRRVAGDTFTRVECGHLTFPAGPAQVRERLGEATADGPLQKRGTVLQDGRAASATTIARKRSVFANVLRYAVEIEELPSNPLDRQSWKPPKVSEVVDRRVAVNARQARELLAAVTYVGYQRRGPFARGQRLMALYACMYYAALRPAEAVALRQQDCYLPVGGWGCLTLEKSRPGNAG
jgi:integrase